MESATVNTTPVVGYGILHSFDPATFGVYGYGFLIHQDTREKVEETTTWLQATISDYYQGKAPDSITTSFYPADTCEADIQANLPQQLKTLDEDVRNSLIPWDLGYYATTWDKAQVKIDEARTLDAQYRAAGQPLEGNHPLAAFFSLM